MSARIVISCDGQWPGFPCRGAFPTRAPHADVAREIAAEHGWGYDDDLGDLCPAHARRREAGAA